MKTILAFTLVGALLFPAVGSAQVEVQRRGEENPVLTVSKSIVYGGLAGLVLGGALALAVDDNQDDIVKWFFVGGTFAGFGAGVYHVAHRPGPSSALLQLSPEGMTTAMPDVEVYREGGGQGGVRVSLLSISGR